MNINDMYTAVDNISRKATLASVKGGSGQALVRVKIAVLLRQKGLHSL